MALPGALPRIVNRIRHEPVVLAGAGLVAIQAWQAAPAGLDPADLFVLIVDAVLIWGARELVFPAIRVKEDSALRVDEPLPAPVAGNDP